MRKAWLLFSQTVTVAVALLFVVATLKPQWLGRGADPMPAPTAAIVTLPAPVTSYAALAGAVVGDSDPDVALGAAQSLCLSMDPDPAASPRPVLDALGAAGFSRLRALVTSDRPSARTAVRDVARCLAAEGSAESAAALRALRSSR